MKEKIEKTGTREWSEFSDNIGVGCSHDCRYCYARNIAFKNGKIATLADWKNEVVKTEKAKWSASKKNGVIMFPTTHDITPAYVETAISRLNNLLKVGNEVLIVSKPNLECIIKLCDELANWKDKILFRFTIGTTDAEISAFWEPGAPTPIERISCLKYAFEKGFNTSVSMEPFLGSVDDAISSFKTMEPYVTDKIWLGKMNRISDRVISENKEVSKETEKIIKNQSDTEIMRLYSELKDNNKVAWKDSVKTVIAF